MSSLVENRLAQMRGWSARLERWRAAEVADSFCTAWQKVAVEPDSCRGGIGQQEEEQVGAPGCGVAIAVESKPGCAMASPYKAADPCPGVCHSNSRSGSTRGDCDVCIHRNDVHVSHILGRRFWSTGRFCTA